MRNIFTKEGNNFSNVNEKYRECAQRSSSHRMRWIEMLEERRIGVNDLS